MTSVDVPDLGEQRRRAMPTRLKHALCVATMVLAGAAWSTNAAKASTLNFTFDVSRIFGPEIGTGSITVDGTHGHDVTALDITVDGINFDFTGSDLHNASATIKNGELVNLKAADITAHGSIALDFLGGIFLDFGHPSKDAVFALTSIEDPPTPAPLPAAWSMMLIGLLGLGVFAFRGVNKNAVTAAG
jgi:hypothetical protein